MVYNLQRLIYFCHIKNELNRKRRRFHYYMSHYQQKRYCPVRCEYVGTKPDPKHISHIDAINGYREAQQEMKSMTRMMREMRVEMGATLVWSDWGAIAAVRVGERYIRHREFKKYYEAEIFEMEMFK